MSLAIHRYMRMSNSQFPLGEDSAHLQTVKWAGVSEDAGVMCPARPPHIDVCEAAAVVHESLEHHGCFYNISAPAQGAVLSSGSGILWQRVRMGPLDLDDVS